MRVPGAIGYESSSFPHKVCQGDSYSATVLDVAPGHIQAPFALLASGRGYEYVELHRSAIHPSDKSEGSQVMSRVQEGGLV